MLLTHLLSQFNVHVLMCDSSVSLSGPKGLTTSCTSIQILESLINKKNLCKWVSKWVGKGMCFLLLITLTVKTRTNFSPTTSAVKYVLLSSSLDCFVNFSSECFFSKTLGNAC